MSESVPSTSTATASEDEKRDREDSTVYLSFQFYQITWESDVQFYTGLRNTSIFRFLFNRFAKHITYWWGGKRATESQNMRASRNTSFKSAKSFRNPFGLLFTWIQCSRWQEILKDDKVIPKKSSYVYVVFCGFTSIFVTKERQRSQKVINISLPANKFK